MFTVQKISEPKIRYVRIYPSVKGKTYMPGKNKFVKIKTSVTAETPGEGDYPRDQSGRQDCIPEKLSGKRVQDLYPKVEWKALQEKSGWMEDYKICGGRRVHCACYGHLAGWGEKQEFHRETKLIVGKK